MIPRLKPTLGWAELFAAMRMPHKDDIYRFEEAFADLMGQKHAIAFPYGRTGLIFLLEALGLKDHEIICPAYTCVVVPHAIIYSGNKPVFVDCAEGEFNMDLVKAESAITKKTGAIIATSLFGYPVDLDRLNEIKKRYPNVNIIQDCAHSFAAEWKGRPVQKEGVASLFGLNISKILTSIFGGMISTDNDNLLKNLRKLRDEKLKPASLRKSIRRFFYFLTVYPTFSVPIYGLIHRIERSGLLKNFVQYYDEGKIDMPVDYLESMSKLEARVGLVNLSRYESIIRARKEAASYYFKNISKISFTPFKMPPQVDGATYSHFIIQVPDKKLWLHKGVRNGVQLGQIIEYCIPHMTAYGNHSPEKYNIAGSYAQHSINLPLWGGAKISSEVLARLSL
jgi:perosamine synthetase